MSLFRLIDLTYNVANHAKLLVIDGHFLCEVVEHKEGCNEIEVMFLIEMLSKFLTKQ